MSLTDKVLPNNAGLELIITDEKVRISVPARARAILDETNAKRGFIDSFGRVRGSNDHPIQRGVVYRLKARWKHFINDMSTGDEDVIRGYHELDQDDSSKP